MEREYTVTEEVMATKGQRFCNYIIDFIVQYAMGALIGVTIVGIDYLTGNYSLTLWLQNMSKIEEYLLGLVIMLVYYITMEGFLSRSVGKYITQTIVVNEDGSKPDIGQITKRSFCRLIPFEHLSFLGHDARGWHDSLSGTYLVKKKDFKQEMALFYSFDEIGKNPE